MNGKDKNDPSSGKFTKGNGHGGNPWGGKQQKFRARFYKSLKSKDIDDAYKVLLEQVLKGNMQAHAMFWSYAIGKPQDIDISEALEALKLLSQPVEQILQNLLLDPDTRTELRKKLKAFDVADQDTGSSTPSE